MLTRKKYIFLLHYFLCTYLNKYNNYTLIQLNKCRQIKKKLAKLRKSLDKLDNSFIKLVKKRTALVKQVLKIKETKSQIIDRKRINFILNQIRKKSIKNKIDPKITNRIWKNMIYSYIDYEKRNFKKK